MKQQQWFWTAVTLQVLDKILTLIGLYNGVEELNPFLLYLINHTGILTGILVGTIISILLLVFINTFKRQVSLYVLKILAVLQLFVVISNIMVVGGLL